MSECRDPNRSPVSSYGSSYGSTKRAHHEVKVGETTDGLEAFLADVHSLREQVRVSSKPSRQEQPSVSRSHCDAPNPSIGRRFWRWIRQSVS